MKISVCQIDTIVGDISGNKRLEKDSRILIDYLLRVELGSYSHSI